MPLSLKVFHHKSWGETKHSMVWNQCISWATLIWRGRNTSRAKGSSHRPQDHWEPGQQSRGESWGKTLRSVSHFCKIGFASNLESLRHYVSREKHMEKHTICPPICASRSQLCSVSERTSCPPWIHYQHPHSYLLRHPKHSEAPKIHKDATLVSINWS